MGGRSIWVVAMCIAFASPTGADAEPRDLPSPPGIWSPPAEPAVPFPISAGGYVRSRIVEYGSDDWSVSYTRRLADGSLSSLITIYFYVETAGCANVFDGAIAAIQQNAASAREIARERGPSPLGARNNAQVARFDFETEFARKVQPVTSQVYVYCHPRSRWTIKVRSTWADGADGTADTYAILKAIAWPANVAE